MTTNNTSNLPIYILGKNFLSLYLAYKLSSCGENVIIITSPTNIENDSKEITIKEEFDIKKQKFIYKLEPYTFTNAKLLIITSEIHKLKSELLLLSPKNLAATPCIIFSDDRDINIAQNIIGKPLVQAWFNGWLVQEDNQINLLGKETSITFLKNYNNIEDCLAVLSIFNRTNIITNSSEEYKQIYWEQVSIKTLGYMLTAQEQQNIAQICKSKEKRCYINQLAEEISSLASYHGAHLNAEDICKKLYSIPSSYSFNTQKFDSDTISKLNRHYLNLIIHISDSKLQLPGLNQLMKAIYLRINPF